VRLVLLGHTETGVPHLSCSTTCSKVGRRAAACSQHRLRVGAVQATISQQRAKPADVQLVAQPHSGTVISRQQQGSHHEGGVGIQACKPGGVWPGQLVPGGHRWPLARLNAWVQLQDGQAGAGL
jgi:hypothetical protein